MIGVPLAKQLGICSSMSALCFSILFFMAVRLTAMNSHHCSGS